MKRHTLIFLLIATSFIFITAIAAVSCRLSVATSNNSSDQVEKISSRINGDGSLLEINFTKGKAFNHPTLAIWLEDTAGNYLQTVLVTKSFATGTFQYGDKSGGAWKPGQVKRPASLPYWSHRAANPYGITPYIPDAAHPVADAVTGATPKGSFVLDSRAGNKDYGIVKLLLEVNQTWDWNDFWFNDKYPGDTEYATSSQPAVVYAATIDLLNPGVTVELKPIGRSHYAGADGKLYSDLETLTTAMQIASKITVTTKKE